MKILIRNLARTTTEKEIRILFAAFGSVDECTLVLDQDTGGSKGFAFVEMPNQEEATTAIANLNQNNIAGNKIRVKFADA
ncbi:RNA-binding protein [Aliiglaciecola sp. LCG003]|uniref:RNA recognition motif domain-containing protein n=1 Tax=Aliiglaciecola sp. LCG003 TaxID=3053655 RepID=UPI0025734A9C|nr:RNA-binding protein [Aliiglaciecola sp. LCG003]WJG10912.1 RNA-binding protein [Aliiglaciecola sp. LCG003]